MRGRLNSAGAVIVCDRRGGGTVEKRVKRDGKCKLVIRPNESKLIVFADCRIDSETVTKRKIRKGAKVSFVSHSLTHGNREKSISVLSQKL